MNHDEALAVAKAAEERWMKQLCDHSYTRTEAEAFMGTFGLQPRKLQDLIRDGKVLAFSYSGVQWLPKCQFVNSQVLPVIAELLTIARDAGATESDLALWLLSPSTLLNSGPPAAHLDNADAVVQAAHVHFEALW